MVEPDPGFHSNTARSILKLGCHAWKWDCSRDSTACLGVQLHMALHKVEVTRSTQGLGINLVTLRRPRSPVTLVPFWLSNGSILESD